MVEFFKDVLVDLILPPLVKAVIVLIVAGVAGGLFGLPAYLITGDATLGQNVGAGAFFSAFLCGMVSVVYSD